MIIDGVLFVNTKDINLSNERMLFTIANIPEDVGIQRQLTSIHIQQWMKEDLFHLKWWLLIGLILLSLFIWWKAADKSRFHAVCLFAALIAIVSMGINEYGEELTLWDYPTDVIPIFPPLSSINLISLPLIYSITYQRFRGWKSFILAVLGVTAVICFVIEPILEWMGLYQLIKWNHFYSFPIYAVAAIVVRAVVIKLTGINTKHKISKAKGRR